MDKAVPGAEGGLRGGRSARVEANPRSHASCSADTKSLTLVESSSA
jgi:hypothetical protein